MAYDFPNAPSVGSIFTPVANGPSWEWNGNAWKTLQAGSMAMEMIVDTVAVLNASNIEANVKVVRTLGYYAINDGGGTTYVRNASATVYQASDGGAVKWQVQQRHDFNVCWYGASPSQADNAPFFALAKQDAKTTALPFTIFIPAGQYEFTSGPAINDSPGSWGGRYVGVGSPDIAVANVAATTLIARNNAHPLVRLDSSDGWSFEGIHFTYVDASYTHDLIDLSGSGGQMTSRVTFHRCRIGGYHPTTAKNAAALIRLKDCLDIHIVRCALNCGIIGIAGPENRVVDTANSIYVSECWIDGTFTTPIRAGGNNWVIENNIFEARTTDKAASGIITTPGGIIGLAITGNGFQDASPAAPPSVGTWVLLGTNSAGITITGNMFHHGLFAVSGTSTTDGLQISGNIFFLQDWASPPTSATAPLALPNCKNTAIFGNSIATDSGTNIPQLFTSIPTGGTNIYDRMDGFGTRLTRLVVQGTADPQTTAKIAHRIGGNNIEFGHGSDSFGSVLGGYQTLGSPVLIMNGEVGTANNTIQSRGKKASALVSDNAGGFKLQTVALATGDSQTPIDHVLLPLAAAPRFAASTAPVAGGSLVTGVAMSSSGIGVFTGTGAPTLTAPKGSLYLRSDGTTTNDRMYVNTNGSTTWTAVTTAA